MTKFLTKVQLAGLFSCLQTHATTTMHIIRNFLLVHTNISLLIFTWKNIYLLQRLMPS